MNYTKPRGTYDLMDQEIINFRRVEQVLRTIAELYGYSEIKTPMFESAELFKKSVGDESDIVIKEFYNFLDKGGREIALRPEGTASAIRALVESKKLVSSTIPTKWYYFGEMFRYERPQSGRQRQFHQFGIECVGDFSVYDEVETIMFAKNILESLKIDNYSLEINNIGSCESRKKYMQVLKEYFEQHIDKLSEDSVRRLAKNPLRILDDKEDGNKDFVINAPTLDEFLTEEEKAYFKQITSLLDKYEINYSINKKLVRGLDYYNGLVFEFISHDANLVAQSTLIGGGRYNSLVKQTGGPDVSGIGFALGMERILIAMDKDNNLFTNTNMEVILLPCDEYSLNISYIIANLLRMGHGLSCCVSNKTFKLDKHFKFVDKLHANNVFILKEDLLKNNQVILKNQNTREEQTLSLDEAIKQLKSH